MVETMMVETTMAETTMVEIPDAISRRILCRVASNILLAILGYLPWVPQTSTTR
jgi:hypothetical protein